MLSQNLNRRDAKKAEWKTETGKWKTSVFYFAVFRWRFSVSRRRGVAAFLSVIIFTACQSSKPTDMRSLVPAETLVYLESKDLAKTLSALTENESWRQLAKSKPDFSYLENTQLAVAVTGFEISEKQLTDNQKILNSKPLFVAVADTHRWESTNLSLAENQIGKFARETYGDDARLEKPEKPGAKWFVWTAAADNRKLVAAVSESVVYLGNDEAAIEKCLAVKRGEAENLTKNESLTRALERAGDENQIAFGYISSESMPQIANLAGVFAAFRTSEDEDARSFTARILPQILQKSVREIVWTARKTEAAIEDKYLIKTGAEISSVLKETLLPASAREFQKAEFLPPALFSVTRYNLQNPQIAWRSVLLTTANQTDATSAKIILQFSDALFEPYEITRAEAFLSAVGAEIITAKFDEEGDKSVVIADVKDAESLKKALTSEINFKAPPEKQGNAEIWKSKDELLAAAFIENKLILGETESVLSCLKAKESGQNFKSTAAFQKISNSPAAALSLTKDAETAGKIVELLGNPKEENKTSVSFYTTETRFDAGGFERKTVSDFGLIGTILESLE
ncbi:MAG TPA: hypothetical protein VF599_12185 [Pyrinomonadaceae bacterium]|jgi:hypothetical protein